MEDQPFYVGNRSRYARYGYLPALELPDEPEPDNDDKKHQGPKWVADQWNVVNQLRAQVLYLQKKVHKLESLSQEGKESLS